MIAPHSTGFDLCIIAAVQGVVWLAVGMAIGAWWW